MPKPGEIRYCPELGGQATNAAFVWIPPGSFWMGDIPNLAQRNPIHFVAISKGFWLQQKPLTERQFYSKQKSELPRVFISWDSVIDFCEGKSLRMPTEAEWEYAARSNTGHKYLWAGSNVVNNVAWQRYNSNDKLHTAGQLKSNIYGLFDMSGNVFTWCSDDSPSEGRSTLSPVPQLNPTGDNQHSYAVVRGGNWMMDPQYIQVSYRTSLLQSAEHSSYIGVRLVWEPKDA